MNDINKHFDNSIFPAPFLKQLPPLKKVKPFGLRVKYEIDVNPEKIDMKLNITDFNEEDIDFRVSFAPVKWGRGEWPASPSPKWYIYEKSSQCLGFADNDMEYCIYGFLYMLHEFGKKHALRKIREIRRR